ncbi:unnamed protein product [Prunus brigantina]
MQKGMIKLKRNIREIQSLRIFWVGLLVCRPLPIATLPFANTPFAAVTCMASVS